MDLYDIPLALIPKGLSYQWCSKEIFGEPNPSYQDMTENGWMPVPFERHKTWFPPSLRDVDGNIKLGGQLLMFRGSEESKEKRNLEMDAAHHNAGYTARSVNMDGPLEVRLSEPLVWTAAALDISCEKYANRRVRAMLDGLDSHTFLAARDGKFEFVQRRRPRHPWLRWLFNLISTES